MKITLDLSEESFADYVAMAKYLRCTPVQAVESIAEGAAAQYVESLGDSLWLSCVEFLRERYGDTERLQRLDRFFAAKKEFYATSRTEEEHWRMVPYWKSLEAWQNLIGEED